jgi:alpha-tubulin suppressor-like RCC1 family protein
VLSVDGHVAVTGRNDSGQLALGDRLPRVAYTRIPRPPACASANTILSVACGWAHTMVVDNQGRVFGAGCNRYGQLGLGRDAPDSASTLTPLPTHSVPPVTRVHCGMRHTVATTSGGGSGGVVGWGSNRHGQLGGKPSREPVLCPTPIAGFGQSALVFCDAPAGDASVGGAAGATADVGSQSSIFAGGDVDGHSRAGSCGDDAVSSPRCATTAISNAPTVDAPATFDGGIPADVGVKNDLVVLGAAAGANHTAIVTSDGSVWCCGSNKWGQCGVAVKSTTSRDGCVWPPRRVPSVVGASAVACGWTHTAVVVGKSSEALAWGRNNFGQLGTGVADGTPHDTPTRVALDVPCVSLCAGSEHTVALDDKGKLWAWGWNEHGILGRELFTASEHDDDGEVLLGAAGRQEHRVGGDVDEGSAVNSEPHCALPRVISACRLATPPRTFGCGAGFTLVVPREAAHQEQRQNVTVAVVVRVVDVGK